MPKQNKLQDQLKSLFKELDQEAEQMPSAASTPRSWQWISNEDGCYLECSQEVSDILGIDAVDFIGKPVAEFALETASVSLVAQAMQAEEFPAEVQVNFLSVSGKPVPVKFCVLSGPSTDKLTWNGVAQSMKPVKQEVFSDRKTVEPIEDVDELDDVQEVSLESKQFPEKRSFRRVASSSSISHLPDNDERPLTAAGGESLKQFQPIFQPGDSVDAATIAVPFRLQEDHVGLLEILDDVGERQWTVDEESLVLQVADQLSLALENARLFQETQAALSETATLYAITSAASRSFELEGTLQEMLKHVLEAIGMQAGLISIADPVRKKLTQIVHYNLPGKLQARVERENGLEGTLCEMVYLQGKPLAVADTSASDVSAAKVLSKRGINSYLGIPLMSKGEVLGSLCAMRDTVYPAPEDSLALMEVSGQQIGIAIENANLFRETQSRAEELAVLNEMSRTLSAQLRVEDVVESTYHYAQRLMKVDNFYVALYSPEEDEVSFPLAVENGESVKIASRQMGQGLTEHVIYTRQPLLIQENAIEVIQKVLGREQKTTRQSPESWLGVPLLIGNQAVGVIVVQDFTRQHVFSERHRDLLTAIASQAAIALQNARLYQEEQRRRQIADSLREIALVVGSTLNLDLAIERMLDQIARLIPFTSASIQLIQDEKRRVIGSRGPDFEVNELDTARQWVPILHDPLIAEMANSRRPVVISDTDEDSRWKGFYGAQTGRSWLAAPLVAGQNVVGALALSHTTPDTYTQESGELAMAVAAQAAVAIQNADLFKQTQQRAEETAALNDMARALSSRLDIQRVLDEVVRGASRLLDTTNFYVSLYDAERHENVFLINATESEMDGEISRLSADEGIAGYIVRTQENVLLRDNMSEWLAEKGVSVVGQLARSWVGVPMISGGQVIGVLAAQSYDDTNAYDEHDLYLLSAIANQASIAIQNARLFEQNQQQLVETEALYKASAELSTVQSFEDVLAVLQAHTVAGQDSNMIAMMLFDRLWSDDNPPEWLETHACLTNLNKALLDSRHSLKAFPFFKNLSVITQHSGDVLIFEDVMRDSRLDEVSRRLYHDTFMAESALVVPMVVGNRLIGCFNITYPNLTPFLDSEIRRLAALTGQAAVAVQNLRSIEIAEQRAIEAQQRSQELALINRIVSVLVSGDDLGQSLDAAAEILLKEFSMNSVMVFLLNDDRTESTIVASKATAETAPLGLTYTMKDTPLVAEVIKTRKQLVIEDVQNSGNRLGEAGKFMLDRGVQSCAFFPIITGGEVIGVITMQIIQEGRTLSEDESSLLTTVVGQVSTAIENTRLHEQTQQALAETANLYQASAELNAVKNYEAILGVLRKSTILGHKNISDVTINIFDHPWLPESKPEWMNALARWPTNPYQQTNLLRVRIGDWSTSDQLFHSDEPVYIENVASDSRIDPTAQSFYVGQLKAKSLLSVPLNVGGQWFGQIVAVFRVVTQLPSKELRPLGTLAGQAAVSIQSIRLLDESRRRAAQLETAAEIARDTSGSLDLNILLRRVVNLMRERYGYYHAAIFLLDESGLNAVVKESTGEAGEEMKRRGHKLAVGSQSVVGYVTQTGAPLIVNDVTQSPTYQPNPLLPDTRAELGLPLKVGYRVMGALDVHSSQVDAFTPDDVAVLQTLADQIAVAVDNARSYEMAQDAISESRKRVQELSVLYNVTQSLSSAPLESTEIASTIACQFIEIMEVPKCTICAYDFQDGVLEVISEMARGDIDGSPSGDVRSTGNVGMVISLSDHPAIAHVMQSFQPLIIQASDPFADQVELAYMKENGIETLIILPLMIKGQPYGVVLLEGRGQERSFAAEQINLAMTLGNSAAVALDNARLYEAQRTTTEKLREVDKLKSQFLANMSHELRTPLNSIIGFSRVILKGIDGPISDLQQQDLTAINSAGQHLLNLINDVLDISKIEAGKMELALEENVNLNDLLNSAMSYAVGLTKDKPIKLIKEIPDEPIAVRADPTKLRQVVINFLSNASKFTEEGSITMRAVEQVSPDGKPEVKVSVIDTGAGISKEDQKKLFQPFTQVDGSLTRKVGGTGLGLSISKRLIEMHNGRVEMESELGVGSTFSVVLPLPYVEVDEDEPDDRRVILAIDDDPQVIGMYERYLSDQGYKVVALTEPEKTLEKVKEIKPYAITLDIMLPDCSGWQILEYLKADPETQDIPVIVCSIVDDQDKGFSLGAAAYLTKPILQDDLIAALNRLNGDGSIHSVLVIDDDEDDLRLVQKILQEVQDYEVRTANGGPEGLTAIYENPPHAIILDLMMPELDGFSLLEAIRSDPDFRDLPVIIFTAGDLDDEQKKHLEELSQEMIFKNAFQEEEILISIERALERFKKK